MGEQPITGNNMAETINIEEMPAFGRRSGAGNGRMANLELLRCVAMMMVVALHYLGKGNLLGNLTSERMDSVGVVAWLLESFCIAAVNVYMFISGYFLCTSSFKVSRLVQLMLQLWAYSVGFGLLGAATGVVQEVTVDTHYLLTLLFPVSMEHYWFMTAYVYMYLLLPFVGIAVKKMTKQQMQIGLGLLFFAYCLMKSVLPIRLEMDSMGYDCMWYLCVFLAAAYVRRFGVAFLDKKGRGIGLYIGSVCLIFAVTFGLRMIYLKTGSLERILDVSLEYNHVLTFAAAVGLFAAFNRLHLNGKIADVIKKVAPYTLGVYLLHENIGLRYTWQNWLGADKISSVGGLLLSTVVAVIVVFVCGILVDMFRKGIFDVLHGALKKLTPYRKLMGAIGQVDALFASKEKYEQEQ